MQLKIIKLYYTMNKKLLIINSKKCHYEILESIIVKYHQILKIKKDETVDIYLDIIKDTSFNKYISDKYPDIKFKNIENYDYYINCTIYDRFFESLDMKESKKIYISHEVSDRLKGNPNVFFLTPLSKKNYITCDILPYTDMKTFSDIPIYIIQGNIRDNRRYFKLLVKILNNNYKHKFIIKIIGKGNLPKEFKEYKSKIVLKNNLSFIDYHKEFLNAYCILPLISKKTHSQYYTKKLTSTMNYASGYNLKCLIDKDLQEIYNLKNVEIYNDINDISIGFAKTLNQFYKKKRNS